MNPSFEEEYEIFQRITNDEITSERDIFYAEISEWLRTTSPQTKACELRMEEMDTEEAFFARMNEISEYLMER
ncbi:hypothetical protein [Aneurinibacillus tyrosinisolvens]|uniref:hypothetical protein n=1 Tax=Aneurinibacillus tyrosinisolvens TaxID=1443435 RepID=UPI00063FC874|nr:hypothetical protein [Aneurinibacillus tyrosinisolvens]